MKLPMRECLIDSGAPLTLIPKRCWTEVVRHIEWLRPTNPVQEQNWLVTLRGRTGGRSKCRLGRIQFQASDMEHPPRFLRPQIVIAQFEEGDTDEDRIIVGLHGSILENRRLIVVPTMREGWLEDL